ncbi:universal stress protein [bacterium]|nr:universal stress protein [bacterium]
MNSHQRIIAAIDFFSHSQLVAEHAANLARCMKVELVFVNVINQRDIDAINYAINNLDNNTNKISLQRCMDQLREEREKKWEQLQETVDMSDLKTRLIIRTGEPYQELLNSVAEEKADMLVMGIKGRSNLSDMMVGSTALKMVKRCPVPLVTVRHLQPEASL